MPQEITLPADAGLDENSIETLAGVFSHRVSSYKFLWTFAILAHVERSDESAVSLNTLCDAMLREAVMPITRYKLNLGPSDRMGKYLEEVLWIPSVQKSLADGKFDSSLIDPALTEPIYRQLQKFVPYRWLRPFIDKQSIPDGSNAAITLAIRRASEQRFDTDSPPPYKLVDDCIVLHPRWHRYFRRNIKILRAWALWHWTTYLQNQNPNIPAVANKIGFPELRGAVNDARKFWQAMMTVSPQLKRCLYSGAALDSRTFHIDHYVPWSFIGHSRPWNLVPTTEEANIKKGDRLPHADYFAKFVARQSAALQAWREHTPNRFEQTIEAYRVDLQLTADQLTDAGKLQVALARTIPPMIETAKNNLFEGDWRYGR